MMWRRSPVAWVWNAVGAGILLLAGLAPAMAGAPSCAPDIAGPWTGKIWDRGQIKVLHTDFTVRNGELTGVYEVEDDEGGYKGTLTDFAVSGDCAGSFFWHDRDGTGVVRVDFRPMKDRFDGEWGNDRPRDGMFFNGRRVRPPSVS